MGIGFLLREFAVDFLRSVQMEFCHSFLLWIDACRGLDDAITSSIYEAGDINLLCLWNHRKIGNPLAVYVFQFEE